MKVEIDSAALAEAVSWTSRIIDARPTAPILSGLKIEASDNTLRFSAMNWELSNRFEIEANVIEEGAVVVRAKMLADITHSLAGEKTTIETIDNDFTLRSGKSSFIIRLMPLETYPALPDVPQQFGQVDSQTFSQAINQAKVAVATDTTRPVLNGIHMHMSGEQVVLTSTDRYRLCRVTFNWSPVNPDAELDLKIRGSFLSNLTRSLLEDHNVVLSVDPDNQGLVAFENAGHISTSQTITGDFPGLDPLFVDDYPIHVVVNRQHFIDAIKRVSIVAERNAPVRLIIEENEMRLTVSNMEEETGNEIVEIDRDGEDIAVAFNYNYLLEGLNAISEPYVRMKISEPVKPVEFNGQQELDSEESFDFRYLMVPMKFGM